MARLENPASSIVDGRKVVTTGGTAVQITTTGTRIRSLAISAESDNTGTIVVGASTVVAAVGTTARGYRLAASESVSLDIDDLSKVYLDATVNGDGVTYTYLA